MRSANEILALVVEVASKEPRVRAALLTGSRADPGAQSDILQDFDVVYLVTEVEPFARRRAWAEQFGEMLILQRPEDMEVPPPARDGTYAYLMLFTDGIRIDLTLCPLAVFRSARPDSLATVLLDKDGELGTLPPPSPAGYVLAPPTEKAFADCCNEWLWVATNVAKGLWRNEIVYAKVMMERYLRPAVMQMLDWWIAMNAGYRINPGKDGRKYRERLPPDWWKLFARSYSDGTVEHTWHSLFALYEVSRRASETIARHHGFPFGAREADNVLMYIRRVRELPADASGIFPARTGDR